MIGRTVLALIMVAGGSVRADDPPAPTDVVAPAVTAPAAEQSVAADLAAYRRSYDGNWRIVGTAGLTTFSSSVQYKFGARSGLGLGAFAGLQQRRLDRAFVAAGVALQWWRERPNRLIPGVVGWTLQAGPMGTAYVFTRGVDTTTVANGGGVTGAFSAYATVPLLHILFDEPPTGWIPHLTWEIGFWGGWAGPMENTEDTDVDGDGTIDHFKGERFVNPDGRSPSAWIGGLLFRSGIAWVF